MIAATEFTAAFFKGQAPQVDGLTIRLGAAINGAFRHSFQQTLNRKFPIVRAEFIDSVHGTAVVLSVRTK